MRDKFGNPVAGIHISVETYNKDVYTAPSGDYWKILLPGTYRVVAHGPGYSSQSKVSSNVHAKHTLGK